MSKDNSPSYALGLIDGGIDARRVSACPPESPRGPVPPNPQYPVMYTKGYNDAFAEATPHQCTAECGAVTAGGRS